jgi:iron complex transport system ATP-binding protein
MLEASNITVRYGDRIALSGVSIRLNRGRFIAVLGPNGSGKSTLLRTLNGTIRPDGGEVRLDDRPIDQISRREIARQIAVVAQENETRFPITVLEFILSGRFIHGGALGWESAEDLKCASTALEECGLQGYESRLMNNLSGGERQRVVLARAVAAATEILLLDEPTANLDVAHQAMMFRLVRRRCREQGLSAIVITHDLNLAAEFADEIVVLREGRVQAIGEPPKVLTEEGISAAFGIKVLVDAHPVNGKVRVTNCF